MDAWIPIAKELFSVLGPISLTIIVLSVNVYALWQDKRATQDRLDKELASSKEQTAALAHQVLEVVNKNAIAMQKLSESIRNLQDQYKKT